MQEYDPSSESESQVDIVELLLKRQAELSALLEVTRAINSNVPSQTLIEMLEMIMRNNLRVRKFRLMLRNIDQFFCVSNFGDELEDFEDLQKIGDELLPLRNAQKITKHQDPLFNAYDYFIPVHHKDEALAFVLVGKFKNEEKLLDNSVDYIQTLINVIIVAFENKKLFKERLHRERLTREVELARQVQNMLIPQDLPNNLFLDVASVYKPHQSIGGDFFDFIQLNNDEFLWCVADVSGKGISAALIMANFQASLRALVSLNITLPELVKRLNKNVYKNTNGDRFITLFIGLYNDKTRRLKYINAGHNASVIIQKDNIGTLSTGTTMIGAFDELPFINEGEIDVMPETIIFNYTDGIVEYDGDEEQSLTEENLLHFLYQNRDKSIKEVNNALIEKIEELRHHEEASDDITILSLKIH
ncbi:PP2C family protein-serine/threonine phosphatase [Pedobacter sp. SD-b]|uniref:PP2C family protein-serine/threonine phosphatase n=1 Tax=Pedobacter segetis TaxID=2793069 RepID=A0ABS1BMI0_9SPHI|nr:PP2C family protein-serine/threonine phosphatase [Pedobacter segetis]MBK0384108.1 PP2C family protein-serine/threonine phosphatase [Pedobacter segetis]